MKLDTIITVRKNKTVYRDGDLCLKLFDETCSPSDVLSEALNLSRVAETDLRVPNLREVAVLDGKWAIIMEYIEGDNLAVLMREYPEKCDEYLELFVNLQMDVHKNKCPLLSTFHDKMHRKVCQTNCDANTRYMLHGRIEHLPRLGQLCHGDFNPSNIIITADGTPYILDWSHATQGDAAADVARSCLLFWLNGEGEIAQKYLELFCAKSQIAKEQVQRWQPVVAASQSVKKHAEELDLLYKWINAVDFG